VEAELIRLSKLMTERGMCSRREADRYIEQGLVLVNGIVIDQLGTKVAPDVKIELARAAQRQQSQLITIMLNKPVGYVSTQPEPGYQPAIQLITPGNQFDDRGQRLKFRDSLAVVGRLDIESQGLLLFTQDGRLAKRIIGERQGALGEIEKEYLVRVTGGYLDEARLQLLRHGLSLDGEKLKPAQVEYLNDDQLRFVLTEGKKRQIRRMCELVNLRVLGLKRVRIGNLRLGNLPEGKWRFVKAEDVTPSFV
jgi:23S rRNA pseudouridine2604 synthase